MAQPQLDMPEISEFVFCIPQSELFTYNGDSKSQSIMEKNIALNYPEKKSMGIITQRVITPTDAMVCKDCGHIELFIDTSKLNRPF